MKTLLNALAVATALTLTLTGTVAQAAPSANQIAASWCSDPSSIGHDGLTCFQAASIKAQEMVWYEAYEDWLIVLANFPATDSEFKRWKRGNISLALGCAYNVRNSGADIRTPAHLQSAALATYNRIMARRYDDRWTQSTTDCGW